MYDQQNMFATSMALHK